MNLQKSAQDLRDRFFTIFESSLVKEDWAVPLPVNEAVPYKTLSEVLNFIDLLASQQLPEWLSMTSQMTSGTSYCFRQNDLLSNPRQSLQRRSVPKTLVCHDYKGGYLKDRYVDYNWEENNGGYIFTQWNLIDSFVYFSHHLVTVPPPCWINAGHAHGVKVLGTVITENKTGADFWENILGVESRWQWFAKALSLICQKHQFDGYLLNVENVISPAYVPSLVQFVKSLGEYLPKSATLIWYDSVVSTGLLRWQNALNQHNVDFFDVCDGIFLNYNYQDWQLLRSAQFAAERRHDVYVGIDAFGRGCPGSGFFCSDAAAMARKHDLSIAVFAPGWTEEFVPGDFILNNKIFWSALSSYLYVHGTSGEISRPKNLIGGKKIGEKNFNNLTGVTTNSLFLWNGNMGSVALALLPPCVDLTQQMNALLELQDAVVTYRKRDVRKYYSLFPVPVLGICEDQAAELSKALVIDTRNLNTNWKIPLMLFENAVETGVSIGLLAKASGSEVSIQVYATVEDEFGVNDVTFTLQLLSEDWESQSFQRAVTGKLLEVGITVNPGTTAYLSKVTVNEM